MMALKRMLLIAVFSVLHSVAFAQEDSTTAVNAIYDFRRQLDSDYQNPKESPLGVKEIDSFGGHTYFPIDLNYRVTAKVEVLKNEKVFQMKTTTDRKPDYIKALKLSFRIQDSICVLYAYRNIALAQKPEYKDQLFLPFTDPTNGFESYGGGRYIDLKMTDKETMVVDFNQSYNPYCAYSGKYSCPVPPKENALRVKINAGILAPPAH
jgi:uncharacterized protein (DUF1684 family)